MGRPAGKKKKEAEKPGSDANLEVLCKVAGRQVRQFYRRWSKAARKRSGQQRAKH